MEEPKYEELDFTEIGKRIQAKRKELKMTQEKLAEKIDVCPSYISDIERGVSNCSLNVISRISQVLHVNIDYFVFGMTENTFCITFSEILKTLPETKHDLYFNLCQNIADVLKNS